MPPILSLTAACQPWTRGHTAACTSPLGPGWRQGSRIWQVTQPIVPAWSFETVWRKAPQQSKARYPTPGWPLSQGEDNLIWSTGHYWLCLPPFLAFPTLGPSLWLVLACLSLTPHANISWNIFFDSLHCKAILITGGNLWVSTQLKPEKVCARGDLGGPNSGSSHVNGSLFPSNDTCQYACCSNLRNRYWLHVKMFISYLSHIILNLHRMLLSAQATPKALCLCWHCPFCSEYLSSLLHLVGVTLSPCVYHKCLWRMFGIFQVFK